MLTADHFAAYLHKNNTFNTVSELRTLAFQFDPTHKARFELNKEGKYNLSNSMFYFQDGSKLLVFKYANGDLELKVYPHPNRKFNRDPISP